ncbi:alpha/beta hydrolase family protein [Nocardioides lianchengensis]|uniref:Prolyl oligopeptidase family protein n=1 Tax=Nocardioides lianchengensis TaxID=1045774 RepID=A0A1G6I495_9ACTN|nr:alpha/beta fold hydrolase [Nocardioides lianchengensis]NYG13178.1 dipeptidyl aminopeptidase/acylaminoacyl peptidase [Nocardioides lianchengensis]SDC01228.1 Prolyl oligopeptidase family protein [Nocardioides lianchengensis]
MRRTAAAALLLLAPLVACSDDDSSDAPDAAPSASTPPTQQPSATSAPTPTEPAEPAEPADTLPPVTDRTSLPQLMREEFRGSRIRFTELEGETASYTRHRVVYRSGDVRVSGVLLRPKGEGPFPGIVLNHGYIDPDVYVTGQGLAREQDWLANAGFVVLHTDYRGHAGSDPATALDRESRIGYTRDALNAVASLKREPYVDADKMAMLGRSMGGGITLNALVAQPGIVDAAVVYASVSSRYLDNLRHFTAVSRPDAVDAVYERFGTPQEAPEVYRGLSSRTYFDRITEPVLMHHGTDDEQCPFPWARTTQRLLTEAGVESRLEVYDGERHAFVPEWQASIEETVRFLKRRLDV